MKGLELSKKFCYECVIPAIIEHLPEARYRIAYGLAGQGSECYGFDDEVSMDHDFGPRVCLWITEEDDLLFGEQLRRLYVGLPQNFHGYERSFAPEALSRSGVIRIPDFYKKLIGRTKAPQKLQEWLLIPQLCLSTATNGSVFEDEPNVFSSIRNELLPCYPEDVRIQKLAACLYKAGQSGQYNYLRMLERGDAAAASLSRIHFAESILEALHLMEYRYAPFYKWLMRSTKELPNSHSITELTEAILTENTEKQDIRIEVVCELISDRLRKTGLSECSDSWLVAQAADIRRNITDSVISELPVDFG